MVTTNQTNKAKPAGVRMRAGAELKVRTEEQRTPRGRALRRTAGRGRRHVGLGPGKNAAICSEPYFRLMRPGTDRVVGHDV